MPGPTGPHPKATSFKGYLQGNGASIAGAAGVVPRGSADVVEDFGGPLRVCEWISCLQRRGAVAALDSRGCSQSIPARASNE